MKYRDHSISWNTHEFILIAPDAVVRGLASDLISRFEQHGFDVVFGKLHWASSEDVDALYSDHIQQQWETYRFRLVDRLLHLAPCVALVLSSRTARGPELFQQINALKGKSNPLDAKPGTLRSDFRSINAILSLMHASDDPAEAEREAGIFLSPDDEVFGATELRELIGATAVGKHVETRDFECVLLGLRSRIVASLYPRLSQTCRTEIVRCLKQGEFSSPGKTKMIAEEVRHIAGAGVAELLVAEFTPGCRFRGDLDKAAQALRAVNVHLDDWELVVLDSSRYFKPRRPMDVR